MGRRDSSSVALARRTHALVPGSPPYAIGGMGTGTRNSRDLGMTSVSTGKPWGDFAAHRAPDALAVHALMRRGFLHPGGGENAGGPGAEPPPKHPPLHGQDL